MADRKPPRGTRWNVSANANSRKAAAREPRLHPETKNSIWAISFICVAAVLVLARFSIAGPAGALIYSGLNALFGWGYLILPATLLFAAAVFLLSRQKRILATTLIGSTLLILSVLGLIELLSPTHGGWLGLVFGSLRAPFGVIAATTIDIFILIISVLVTANVPIKVNWPWNNEGGEEDEEDIPLLVTGADGEEDHCGKGNRTRRTPGAIKIKSHPRRKTSPSSTRKNGDELVGKTKKPQKRRCSPITFRRRSRS